MKRLIILILLIVPFIAIGALAQDDEEANTEDEPPPVTTRNGLPDSTTFLLVEVAGEFQTPLYVTHASDGTGRLFVVEQTGRIWVIKDSHRLPDPFIDLSDRASQDVLSGYSERGLLGLAFHPDYVENSQFYVNYTDRNGTTNIVNFSVSEDNPDRADGDSARTLLTIPQFAPNHNGGHMTFGPDGYLYIAVGDGGSAGDPQENGQNPSNIMGSVLRIDVDDYDFERPYGIPEDNPYSNDPSIAPEVWAYGLRNPWRFSFDRATGDLYIADVGQARYEEVNFQPADSPGGENYGWDVFEGNEFYEGWQGASQVETVFPIATYGHDQGCSITGGYVYRGENIPALTAAYFYSDYCQGNIWAAYRDADGNWQSGLVTRVQNGISSFGEDEDGEIYALDYREGRLLKFIASE